MAQSSQTLALALVLSLLLLSQISKTQARISSSANLEKSAVFLSPRFELAPGSVVEKFYYKIDFPRGHIGLKDLIAEVVDENGNPIPLHETYLHHWTVSRFYQRKGVEVPKHNENLGFTASDRVQVRNSGLCDHTLGQFYGLGSETRRTLTHVPDPYAIETGNPSQVPEGYEEIWMLNVHAIDTRGVDDRLGCTECKCDLYNITTDSYGQPLSPDYVGGLRCCNDGDQCRVKRGFEGVKRGLYMRYTVRWVDWDDSIVPVRVYILDVTDLTGRGPNHARCMVEYDVESCPSESSNNCIDNKRVSLTMPVGGNVVYGVAHQHTGGIGSALYGQDGRIICSSLPTYGEGAEAGNEKGYIVGMSSCYPNPGSVKIYDGETLVLESNYSKVDRRHTGVMGLFYVLVAEDGLSHSNSLLADHFDKHSSSVLGIALFGVAIVVGALIAYSRRSVKEDGYESIAA